MNQQSNSIGNYGNNRDELGMVTVQMPKETWEKIEDAVEIIDRAADEEVVLRKFHWTKKTLLNKISNGSISHCCYTISPVSGQRFYNLPYMMGLEIPKL